MNSRYTAFVLCILLTIVSIFLIPWRQHTAETAATVFGVLSVIGVIDLLQGRHSIQRNYPVIGHIRWMVELVRPEIRQYVIEGDEDGGGLAIARSVNPSLITLATTSGSGPAEG